MRRVEVGEPTAKLRVEHTGVRHRDEMRGRAAAPNQGGEEAQGAARALEAALGLSYSDEHDIKQLRRERERLAKQVGIVRRDVNAEAPPSVEVALNHGVDFGGRRKRRVLEQAVKENFSAVGGILEAEFDAGQAFQRKSRFEVAVVNRRDEHDI